MNAPPDWDRLPEDPVGFFGLSEPFDARALKQAYVRLLRVYKPERAPEEFRRIRAAFEALDARLRYERFDPPAPVGASPLAELRVVPAVDAWTPFREAGADAARAALRAAPALTPEDWCRLALVEEAREGGVALFATLSEGIRRLGAASGSLIALFRAALHEGVPTPEAVTLIRDLRSLATGPGAPLAADAYWFLSEPLWLSLAGRLPSGEVEDLFDEASAAIGEPGHGARLVLLVSFLRRMAFRASDEWLAARVHELEEAYFSLHPGLRQELDLFLWSLQYRDERDAFRRGGALHAMLDAAACAIVEGEVDRADRLFLEAMAACAEDPSATLSELTEAEPPARALAILDWHAHGIEAPIPPTGEADDGVEALVRRVMRRYGHSVALAVWGLGLTLLFFVFVVAIPVAWIALTARLFPSGDGAAEHAVALCAYAVVLWRVGWYASLRRRLGTRMASRIYRRSWRDTLVAFVEETGRPVEDLRAALRGLAATKAGFGLLHEAAAHDTGLFVYSLALRFAR